MAGKHTLVFIHGMGDTEPVESFKALRNKIRDSYDRGGGHRDGDFDNRYEPCFVDWHHITMDAKERVFDAAFAPMEPQRTLVGGITHPIAAARTFMTFFIGDVAAYVSENNNNIRVTVWEKMKRGLDLNPDGPYSIIAHSLGSVIAFDFLFNLFEDRKLFDPIPVPTDPGELDSLRARFRGLYTMGSPIGLFMLRKGELWKVDDPARNGGPPFSIIKNPLSKATHTWTNFYDKEDVIAYPLRRLFDTNPAYNANRSLEDVPVETGWQPVSAHTGYWECGEAAQRIAGALG